MDFTARNKRYIVIRPRDATMSVTGDAEPFSRWIKEWRGDWKILLDRKSNDDLKRKNESEKKTCVSRESNAGPIDGNDGFYH